MLQLESVDLLCSSKFPEGRWIEMVTQIRASERSLVVDPAVPGGVDADQDIVGIDGVLVQPVQ